MRLSSMLLILLFFFTPVAFASGENAPLKYGAETTDLYSLGSVSKKRKHGNFSVYVSMSGGGTRAAALSYGVLKGLKDVLINVNGERKPLLEEIDYITSVSGGSFTAAYYGLFGNQIFTDFEKDFLYAEVGRDIFWKALNPSSWGDSNRANHSSISYYENKLFKGATFADFDQENSPFVIINATDLGGGIRFSFTQEYFNLLCSDISSFPVASAVVASSAVPIVFEPIVLKNHTGCGSQNLLDLREDKYSNEVTKTLVRGLVQYADKDEKRYIHLVDGGITDNLGLMAFYDLVNLISDDYDEYIRYNGKQHKLVISIDASTTPVSALDRFPESPGITETLRLMSNIQIHRMNDVAKSYSKQTLLRYSQVRDIDTFFVDINLSDLIDSNHKDYLNNIPTHLQLEPQQVDALIREGEYQLKTNAELIRFLSSIEE